VSSSAGEGWGWSSLADGRPASAEWSHSGIAVHAGILYWADPAGGALVAHDPDTGISRTIPVPLLEIHGITPAPGPGPARLWLADPGFKARPPAYEPEVADGRVGLFDVGTGAFAELPVPAGRAEYRDAAWRPTAVAVDADGSTVVVADGYGASLVHVFVAGERRLTLDGTEGGLRFACPHGVAIVPSPRGELLVVADRGNHRLVVHDLDGAFVCDIRDDAMRSPSGLAPRGGSVVVTDLDGAVLQADVGTGAVAVLVGAAVAEHGAGWPNAERGGALVRPPLRAGVLNSPHGVAVLPDGSICLTEWVIGGRQVRLAPPAPGRG
jgi:hypothetical protein